MSDDNVVNLPVIRIERHKEDNGLFDHEEGPSRVSAVEAVRQILGKPDKGPPFATTLEEVLCLRSENAVLRNMLLRPDPAEEKDSVRLHREKMVEYERALVAEARVAALETALKKIAGHVEYDPEDHERAAAYKRDEGAWTTDEYLADASLTATPHDLAKDAL